MTTPNTPQPIPPNSGEPVTDSLNTIFVLADGPGDSTVRPTDPNLPLGWWPRPQFPPKRPDNGQS